MPKRQRLPHNVRMSAITALIKQSHSLPTGSAAASPQPVLVDGLFELLYADLRRMARSRLRQSGNAGALNTTALVHESYLRLSKLERLPVQDRGHFLAYAAQVMRSVIVDLVREAQALRRGAGEAMITLNTAVMDGVGGLPSTGDEVLAVHEALEELAAIEPRLARVVEMRYFVGLEMEEIAQALNVAKRTVERDWEKARSYLYVALRAG
jgi:RNA polymerase sigma factor (TIGR02999 family)